LVSGLTVLEAFEPGVLDLPYFYFAGDDYRYHRFETEAKRRFLDLPRERFNRDDDEKTLRHDGSIVSARTKSDVVAQICRLLLAVAKPTTRNTTPMATLGREGIDHLTR